MTEPASLPLIVGFLRRIGLVVDERTLAGPTFLPGIRVERGGLVFDPYRLAHPGDLLHEAGHLAVVPPGQRAAMDGAIDADPGEEMAAIAWSWAAAQDLGLAPEALFHADGYKGGLGRLDRELPARALHRRTVARVARHDRLAATLGATQRYALSGDETLAVPMRP